MFDQIFASAKSMVIEAVPLGKDSAVEHIVVSLVVSC